MHLNNLPEIGSWADWVSGIGSISASVVALYLARRQNLLADRQRDAARSAEQDIKRSLVDEVVRLTKEIKNEAEGTASSSKVETLSEHLAAMGELAKSDPRLFGQIAMTVRGAKIFPHDKTHFNHLRKRMDVIAANMEEQIKAFESLL